MNAPIDASVIAQSIEFTLDGQSMTARVGETILQAAARQGVDIPHLCYKDGYRPDGNCRACVVEIDGERVLAPSCCRAPTPGMNVKAESERAVKAQKMVVELLLSDMPDQTYTPDSELAHWAEKLGVTGSRFEGRDQPGCDLSHPAMSVYLDGCIQCNRCVRACREEQGNDVIGYAFRGSASKIVFDQDDPMGASTCVACGECVQACPTGALMPAGGVGMVKMDKTVDSVCPYCGVGCQLTYHVKDDRVLMVSGRDGPANEERLCVKGRFGFDYARHPQRLTKPLIRRADAPKHKNFVVDPGNPLSAFREASWEEAIEYATSRLRTIRDTKGPNALAGFGSAKGSNEEAYLFQKLIRTGFGTNNVDHCTRLCHASSVAALLEAVGSGAVSNPVRDVLHSDVIFLIGANPLVNHPVGATWIKNAVRQGARLIVCDPRRNDLQRYATHFLQFKPDTDVAMLNAMMHVIIEEGLVDEAFVRDRTSGFDALKKNVADFSPERMAKICGIPAETLREVARMFATSKASMILWGMGVSQHVHGTDNARCLISMVMMTGQIGRRGTGLHPLRGQNNVQGASDAGLIPMVFPDYQAVGNKTIRDKFEELWGSRLDANPGLTVVEIMDAIHAGKLNGCYIMGENPAMSDPDVEHARDALAKLDCLVVQDIFLTETAYFADVVLPASAFPEKTGTFTNTDRQVQLGRQAINPPGDARQDLWIIQQMANGMGLDWHYDGAKDVFNEMRKAMHSIAGITWERLEAEHSVTYPCENEGDPGDEVVFIERFPTQSGRAKLVPAKLISANEKPDADFPMVLITGRQLEHWHTGSMTRRASVLDNIEPIATVTINPADMAKLKLRPGEVVTVESRRGKIALYARVDGNVPVGAVFIPFAYYEAAANMLTNPALDPFGKIPEFKYCAVRLKKGGMPTRLSSYGGGQAKMVTA
ncbi:MAG: formate dehydrogenase subunit alpha [Methyloversatilis sp.]|uniref:formate dehydrogenase subunit alpha n=1 Tax=Methyloversatilis sp. TaxID=2569862 RepID=UPI00273285FF|nr:formate dehydrogenase subunit alpha [Methyloversatilis sp.]MDP2867862.1 formate dehydrogenase subunit alpha [Methyloversatilis sp.]